MLGKGTAVKSGDSSITYTPDSNDEGGVTRILYSLTDDFDDDGNGDFKVGSVDISVSEQTVNQAPVANHFNWNNNGTKIALGTKYTIDVTNIIDGNCTIENNDGNTATNSCIFDPDTSDELQLVGIFAYDATVAPTSLTALDSTKFDVTFNRTGIHDITYYISDHAGGYAIGIMRVDIPHNNAPVFNGPKIINVNAGSFVDVTDLSTIISDPEGKSIEIVSITTPSEGAITNLNKTALTFTYTPLTTTIGLVPVKVTFTDGTLTTVGDIIFIVEQINSLSLTADRNVTASINTPVVINIKDYIVGLTTTETMTITQISGTQLGSTVISTNNPHLVTYTPNNNVFGVDDFAFTIQTNLGNIESGDISITIGNPPPLVISNIEATENKATDVITASVVCANCDVTQYQYSWAVKGSIISTDKSFTITPDQRSYDILLTVFAKDAFSQSDFMQKGFNFFEQTVGTFDTPADSCQAIYDEYNSPDSLVVDDGEYWINGALGKYKTQCDMVTRSQATAQSKQHYGGYTLIWSYSEKTNLERFHSSKTKQFSQRYKNIAFSDNRPRGVVSTESGTVNYNDFRVSLAEMTRLGTRVTRFGYTSDPSVETIDADPDNTVRDWIIESTGPVRFVVSPYNDLNGNQLIGKYKGYSYKMESNNYVTIGNDTIGRAVLYNSGYGWHFDHNDAWPAEKVAINNTFGFWGENTHEGSDLFGTCTNPTMMSAGGYTALGCNGDVANAMTYHNNINSGEGYVMQWWLK